MALDLSHVSSRVPHSNRTSQNFRRLYFGPINLTSKLRTTTPILIDTRRSLHRLNRLADSVCNQWVYGWMNDLQAILSKFDWTAKMSNLLGYLKITLWRQYSLRISAANIRANKNTTPRPFVLILSNHVSKSARITLFCIFWARELAQIFERECFKNLRFWIKLRATLNDWHLRQSISFKRR